MRLSAGTGKEDCRIIDFVDSTTRVAGVVSTPTLFGLDPGEMDIDGNHGVDFYGCADLCLDETTDSLEKKVSDRVSGSGFGRVPEPKSVTYTDYENPFDLVDQAAGAPNINTLSTFAWVGCGADTYILECLGKGYIRVEFMQATESKSVCLIQV